MRKKLVILMVAASLPVSAQQHDSATHGHHAPAAGEAAENDTRVAVRFPEALKTHTLSNMRDHLLALQEIQLAMAQEKLETAAEIAERRLGMSSLATHGAHEVAPLMPAGMREAGTAMHRGASRFGIAVRDAAATGDLKPALAALAEVTAACVACHAGYRLE